MYEVGMYKKGEREVSKVQSKNTITKLIQEMAGQMTSARKAGVLGQG